MAAVFKISRIAFFFAIYFVLCSVLAAIVFPSESEGAQGAYGMLIRFTWDTSDSLTCLECAEQAET